MKTITLSILLLISLSQSCEQETISASIEQSEIQPNKFYKIPGCIIFAIKPNLSTHTTFPYSLLVWDATTGDKIDEIAGDLKAMQSKAKGEVLKCE